MSERTLKRLVIALAVLIVTYGVTLAVDRSGPDTDPRTDRIAERLTLQDTSELQAVHFFGGVAGDAVRVERADGRWRVDGHPADTAEMGSLLRSLASPPDVALVSVSSSNHERLGVDSASARRMVLERRSGSDTLLVGDYGGSDGGVYVRLPGRDDVYHVGGRLRSHAVRSAADWRSPVVARVDSAAVTRVDIRRDGRVRELRREEAGWRLDGAAVDGVAIRELLGELASLRASSFPDAPTEELEEGSEARGLSLFTAGDSLYLALEAVAGEGGDWTARVRGPAASQPDVPFTVPSWRIDRLIPDSTAFAPLAED